MADKVLTEWAPENAPYWDATRQGRLLLKKCTACARLHYYPREICPFCASADTEWIQSSGKGTVYSFSVVRQVSPPDILAYITLKEGVTMFTNLVGCDPERLRIGQAVQVVFLTSDDGRQIPVFTPVG